MNVQAVRLRNFRGFRSATLPLRPLTILLGPNSAGKSAWGHAMAAMAHAHALYPSGDRLTLTANPTEAEEWPIDLGLLSDLRSTGTSDRVFVGLQTSEGWVDFGFGAPGLFDGSLRISQLGFPIGATASTTVPTTIDVNSTVATQSIPISAALEAPNAVSGGLRVRRRNEVEWQDLDTGDVVTVDLQGLQLIGVRHRFGGTSLSIASLASRDVAELLDRVTYLRASRQRPLRGYRRTDFVRQEIGYGGEGVASVLLKRGTQDIEWAIPPNADADSPEQVRLNAPWERHQGTVSQALAWWLSYLGIAQSITPIRSPRSDSELQLRASVHDGESRDITEVGFGVSQVVPVITAGLTEPENGLFIVDLPEAHLHPRPQAALADFFCSLAMAGRNVIVETHSEMFFHQLRLRHELSDELAKKIAVYFIDAPSANECSLPRLVGMNSIEELRWPVGFLQEGWEIETRISAAREAKKRSVREGRSA